MDEITITDIRDKIYTIRGQQVMLDRDLAILYHVDTKRINEAVKRNIKRFPEKYCFQLHSEEMSILWSQNASANLSNKSRIMPHAFTEQGVSMLSAVLSSDYAIEISIQIINAFVSMRHYLADNAAVFQRLDRVEFKQSITDEKVDQIFKQLEQPKPNSVNIFFKGQMWDALSCIEEIISKAKDEIILIDGYVDKSTLDVLSKKKNKIPVTIITYKQNCKITDKEIEDFRAQYGKLEIKYSNELHDRFLILDKKELYHIGASIKVAGKKGFAIMKDEENIILDSLIEGIVTKFEVHL